jgi:DNA repair photolyase
MNPIVPGISSKPSLIEATMKAVADHGARFVGSNVMFLEGGTRDHFMRWLGDEYPHLVEGYRHLYAGKYAPSAYRTEVSKVIDEMRKKYGLGEREQRSAREIQQSECRSRTGPGTEVRGESRLDFHPDDASR